MEQRKWTDIKAKEYEIITLQGGGVNTTGDKRNVRLSAEYSSPYVSKEGAVFGETTTGDPNESTATAYKK